MKMQHALDLGCGRGFHAKRLSKVYEAHGIDLSDENIALCKDRYPEIDYRVMNASKMEFPDKFFARVDALDILEHVDNLKPVIQEVYRVLKKGGIFIINVPAEKSEYWLLKLRPSYHKEIHHVRIFKGDEMKDLLEGCGFRLIKQANRDFLQHIELFFMFRRKPNKKSQVSIGDWRENTRTKLLHVGILFFDPEILTTPLKYFPVWILTLPIGLCVNWLGNKIFPKSVYFEFVK